MRTQFCQEVLSKTYYMWCCVEAFGGLHYNPKARLPAAARDRSPRSSPGRNKKDRTRESGGNRAYVIPSTVYLSSEYHGGKPTDKKLILQLFDSVMRQTKKFYAVRHTREFSSSGVVLTGPLFYGARLLVHLLFACNLLFLGQFLI